MLALCIFAVVAFFCLWMMELNKIQSVRSEHEELKTAVGGLKEVLALREQECSQLKSDMNALQQQNQSLSRYKYIVDTESHAQKIVADANKDAESIRSLARSELEAAKTEAKTMSREARTALAESRAKAQAQVNEAFESAGKITREAEERAKQIAGNAYEALKKAEALEKTAQAMKNIIEGYGDQYLVPTTSLLDHLAEDYSHTQAGVELKRARASTRSMIKAGTAASCEYVDDTKKKTAIHFVLDAFNGKVDSALSNVKDDNFGTLEQTIKDAFYSVNHTGAAFRNARITDLYFASRLEELKWACTAQALKEKDREEQRRIREQMREEERATKEIERALRDAQKEEESIAKSMDKVKKDLESANEEQRLKYEARLAELQQKLVEAEEKNQRALSMAQQTKRGYVYIISNVGSFGEDVIKIGMTRRLDPMDRIDELGDASVPFDFDVHAMIHSEDAPSLEKELHSRFASTQVNKINPRKEFFKLNISDIKAFVEKKGIDAHWTMTAEAREYRESLAAAKNAGAEKAA